jgi:hypothetical protein
MRRLDLIEPTISGAATLIPAQHAARHLAAHKMAGACERANGIPEPRPARIQRRGDNFRDLARIAGHASSGAH